MNNIVADSYSGGIGDTLTIEATDDTKVKTVDVVITAADGTQVETGSAMQQGDSPLWFYTTTALNNVVAGSKIKVTAKDLPGNAGVQEVVL